MPERRHHHQLTRKTGQATRDTRANPRARALASNALLDKYGFAHAEVAVSSIPLLRMQLSCIEPIEDWPYLDSEVLLKTRSRKVCLICHRIRHQRPAQHPPRQQGQGHKPGHVEEEQGQVGREGQNHYNPGSGAATLRCEVALTETLLKEMTL